MTVSPSLIDLLNQPQAELPLPMDAMGDAGNSQALTRVMRAKVSSSEAKLRKALPIMKRAVRLMNENRHREAAIEGLKALDIDETLALANHITAIALDKLGCASLALEMYERAVKFDPAEPEVYQNLGLLAWRMDLYDVAEKFFRIFCRMMPDAIEGPNNLACVLRDKGQFGHAIEVLRTAIYANPDASLLWNSLGTVMMEQTEFDQAVLFYNEALTHDSLLARAHHNIGYCRATEGEHEDALAAFRTALDLDVMPPHEAAETQHARSVSLIALGRLDEGWKAYGVRNEPRYSKSTMFDIPCRKWAGEDLSGKRLLVVGEQGLGDEVMFLNQGHDLIEALGPDGHLTIAVTTRLAPLMKRSFPEATITKHATIRNNGLPWRGCPFIEDWSAIDCWAPMGDLLTVLRDDISKFPATPAFLTPDPDRVAHWTSELEALGPGLKCGLLWKSMLMSARRSKYYSPFAQWADALRTEGVVWVNLQYGDCDDDLTRAAKDFGVRIHQMDGIDLKDDLDDLAALCAALDLVAGPMNATTNISSAVGAETAIIAAPRAWPYLGTGKLPWYPSAKVFSPETLADWKPAMRAFETYLKDRVHAGARLQGAA